MVGESESIILPCFAKIPAPKTATEIMMDGGCRWRTEAVGRQASSATGETSEVDSPGRSCTFSTPLDSLFGIDVNILLGQMSEEVSEQHTASWV